MTLDINFSLYSSMIALRCVIEHPVEVGKVRNQLFPNQSMVKTIQMIYSKQGFKGFFAGSFPNIARKSVKEFARWHVISLFHSLAKTLELKGAQIELTKAVGISTVEALLIQPFERLILAKVNEKGYRDFYEKKMKVEGIGALYRGFSVSFPKRFLGWGSFMTLNHLTKREVRRLDPEKHYPILSIAMANTVTAVGLTVICLPFEFVYTQLNSNKELQKKPTYVAVREIFLKNRVRCFYAGFGFNFLQAMIQASVGGMLLDRITHSHA